MHTQNLAARSSCEWAGDAIESHAGHLCGKPCGEIATRCNVRLSCTNAAVPRIVAGSMGYTPLGPVTPRGKSKKKTAQAELQTPPRSKWQVLRHALPECPSRTTPLTGRGVSVVRFFPHHQQGALQ